MTGMFCTGCRRLLERQGPVALDLEPGGEQRRASRHAGRLRQGVGVRRRQAGQVDDVLATSSPKLNGPTSSPAPFADSEASGWSEIPELRLLFRRSVTGEIRRNEKTKHFDSQKMIFLRKSKFYFRFLIGSGKLTSLRDILSVF